jgi:signal peptidase II
MDWCLSFWWCASETTFSQKKTLGTTPRTCIYIRYSWNRTWRVTQAYEQCFGRCAMICSCDWFWSMRFWKYQKQKSQTCDAMDDERTTPFSRTDKSLCFLPWRKTLWKSFAMQGETSRVADMKKIYYIGFLLLLCCDQITKRIFVQSSFAGFLKFFPPVWNSGSARSVPVNPYVSVMLGFGCIVFLLRYSRKYKVESTKYIYILMIAGIVGNMIDRIMYGAVRDFLWIGDWFPIFNLADVYMCVGVVLVRWREWKNNQ